GASGHVSDARNARPSDGNVFVCPCHDRSQSGCFRTGVQFSAREDSVCLVEKESCLDRLTRNFHLCFPETFRMGISRLNISSWRPLIAMYVSPRRIYSRPESPELERSEEHTSELQSPDQLVC